MAAVTYDIEYSETRNRLTNAFRLILAVPHFVVFYVWRILAQVLALIQWFVILFTGRRNEGIWNMHQRYLGYVGRVTGYAGLMFDEYPGFGSETGGVPVRFEPPGPDVPNRLTNALRIIWAIPAVIIQMALGIAFAAVGLVSWFAIVITGRHPRGMFDFMLKVLRFSLRTESYLMLTTDTYPKFE